MTNKKLDKPYKFVYNYRALDKLSVHFKYFNPCFKAYYLNAHLQCLSLKVPSIKVAYKMFGHTTYRNTTEIPEYYRNTGIPVKDAY